MSNKFELNFEEYMSTICALIKKKFGESCKGADIIHYGDNEFLRIYLEVPKFLSPINLYKWETTTSVFKKDYELQKSLSKTMQKTYEIMKKDFKCYCQKGFDELCKSIWKE